MRYSQNKDQSAELLRLALPLMARQSAALHPISYTLWYEHVAGINPPLSSVLEASLAGKLPLGDDDVYDLHARFVVARDMEVLERLQRKLRQVLEEAAQTAAVALEDSGQFEATLRDTRSRRAAGVVEKDDVLRAEVQLSAAEEDVDLARQGELNAIARLNNSVS